MLHGLNVLFAIKQIGVAIKAKTNKTKNIANLIIHLIMIKAMNILANSTNPL